MTDFAPGDVIRVAFPTGDDGLQVIVVEFGWKNVINNPSFWWAEDADRMNEIYPTARELNGAIVEIERYNDTGIYCFVKDRKTGLRFEYYDTYFEAISPLELLAMESE